MTTAAVALAGLVAFPSAADARPFGFMQSSITFVNSHASCGCPIYKKRVFRGYDRFHRPVFIYESVPFKCGCKKTTVVETRSWDAGHRGWMQRDRGDFFRRALIRALLERRIIPTARGLDRHRGHRDARACASGRCGDPAPRRGGPLPNFGNPAPGPT